MSPRHEQQCRRCRSRRDGAAATTSPASSPGDEVEEDDGRRGRASPPCRPGRCRSPRSTGTAQAGDADGKVGADVIQTLVKRLPNAPGVYRMMNAAGDVLYVGKARSLKKRVTNYAQGRFHTNRIGRMVRETATMEFVVTRTEIEALLLEANLIKRLRPRFNVLMRDDKSFPYILLTGDHPSPGIFKHRGARSRKGDYFGPFASAGAVGRTINSLQRAFLLRTCTDSVFESRTRPCLLYQIKRCSGPCTGEIGAEDYAELVERGQGFPVRPQPEGEDRDFGADAAGGRRPRFRARRRLSRPAGGAVACAEPSGHQPARRRGGRRLRHPPGGRPDLHPGVLLPHRPELGQPRLFPEGRSGAGAGGGAGSFLAQFYDDKPCPRAILLSQHGRGAGTAGRGAVDQGRPQGDDPACRSAARRRIWSTMPLQNAREALGRRLAETSTQARLLAGFAETFGLDKRAAAHRGLRQLAHHGHQCGRRDDRRRARKAS